MKNFIELIDAIQGEPVVWHGNILRIHNGQWSTMSDTFDLSCVSIFDPKKFMIIQFSGHYIGQMKDPKEFYDMIFRHTPPNVMENKLFKLVFL